MKKHKEFLALWPAVLVAGLAMFLLHLSISHKQPTTITIDGQTFEVLEYSAEKDAYRIGEGLWVKID